ncbi:MAG: DUF2089 domain-containing protein [Gammaproteobacteria bacterium]|nr:DUF2089 domain-containing protein [Gammaproteobacteria bacterium]
MRHCPSCHSGLEITGLRCPSCDLVLSGRFPSPRLARLSAEHLALTEGLVLARGNLKELAGSLQVSYPTLRKRLNDLMAELRRLRDADERRAAGWLDAVERGDMSAEEAGRLMRHLRGGA